MGTLPLDKDEVARALRAFVDVDDAEAQDEVDTQHSASELDQESAYDIDDQFQADTAGDLAGLFERAEAGQRARVAAVDALDFGPKETAEPGAVVVLDDQVYVIGVATEPFQVDGREVVGISTDAPIWLALRGTRAGDTFTFDGRTRHVDAVG